MAPHVQDLTSSSQLPTIEIDPTCGEVEVYLLPLPHLPRHPFGEEFARWEVDDSDAGRTEAGTKSGRNAIGGQVPGVNLRSGTVVS